MFNSNCFRVTNYLAIDCEMDHLSPEHSFTGSGLNIPCKVSIVNEQGLIVLDTLIQPCVGMVNYPNVKNDLDGYKSLESIHGIPPEWLVDAPTFESVRNHILEFCGKKLPKCEPDDSAPQQQDGTPPKSESEDTPKKDSIDQDEDILWIDHETYDPDFHSTFIGHGVTLDLKVMGIGGVPYLCT